MSATKASSTSATTPVAHKGGSQKANRESSARAPTSGISAPAHAAANGTSDGDGHPSYSSGLTARPSRQAAVAASDRMAVARFMPKKREATEDGTGSAVQSEEQPAIRVKRKYVRRAQKQHSSSSNSSSSCSSSSDSSSDESSVEEASARKKQRSSSGRSPGRSRSRAAAAASSSSDAGASTAALPASPCKPPNRIKFEGAAEFRLIETNDYARASLEEVSERKYQQAMRCAFSGTDQTMISQLRLFSLWNSPLSLCVLRRNPAECAVASCQLTAV
jgi:hypothetical protein